MKRHSAEPPVTEDLIEYTTEIEFDVGDEVWRVQNTGSFGDEGIKITGPHKIRRLEILDTGNENTVRYGILMLHSGSILRATLKEATVLAEFMLKAAKEKNAGQRYVRMEFYTSPHGLVNWQTQYDDRTKV